MKRKIIAVCNTIIEYSLYGVAGTLFFAWSAMQMFFAFMLLAFFLKAVLTSGAEYKKFKPNLFDKAFFVFIIVSFISCLIGIDPVRSLGQHAYIKTAGWMFMYIIVRLELKKPEQIKTAFWVLLFSAFAGAVYALGRGISRSESRLGGGLGHPIHLGMGMNFALALLFAVFLFKIEQPVKNKKSAVLQWLFLLGTTVLCVIALVGAKASSAYVALAAFIPVMAVVSRKKIAFILVAALTLVFISGVMYMPKSKFGQAITKISDTKNLSVAERLLMWKSGAQIIKDYPLGVGIDNLSVVYLKYVQPGAIEGNQGHLHNNFIQLAVERGLPGLLAYLFFLASFYIVALKALPVVKSTFEKYIVIGVVGVFTVFWITGFFEYTWGASHGILNLWFIIGLGMAVITRNKSARRKDVHTERV